MENVGETKPSATSSCHTDGGTDTAADLQFSVLCQVFFFFPPDVFQIEISHILFL